jgi:hypothetical protein
MNSRRFLILVSPHGHLTVRRADWFREHPTDHARKWQVLTYIRPPAGAELNPLLFVAYCHLIRQYAL